MAPIFDYKAFNRAGKPEKGLVESDTAKNARGKLKKQGLIVTDIKERTAAKPTTSSSIPFLSSRVSVKDLSLMTRQLASLIKANITLVESLTAMVEQTEHERLKVTLAAVREDVNEGASFAKALGKHPKVFDSIFINMVEAGEQSGTLGVVLLKLADLKEAQVRLRNKVISGMTYPGLMLFVAVALMLAIFTFVIPKLTQVFVSMNKPVPPLTQFFIWISAIITDWWFLIGGAGFMSMVMFQRYISSTNGRKKWDAFILRVALFGPLLRMVAITRFASTMSTLLGSGVPIVTAMTIAKNLVGNVGIAQAIENARANITEGQSIAEPLRRSGEFPPMVIHMIAIGEKTGELPDMLKNVAATYEEQVNAKIESMTSLIEPMMIIFMGGMVAVIVLSVFLPLMDMSNLR